jgi:hypothetical protein
MSASPLELDVRVIPPRDKHAAIFRAFDGLASGRGRPASETVGLASSAISRARRVWVLEERDGHLFQEVHRLLHATFHAGVDVRVTVLPARMLHQEI